MMKHDRVIPLKSAYNFRDLGGYKSEDGRSVRWRKLIRCGDFPALVAEDVSLLRSIGVRTVVDFRALSEVSQLPDSYIGNDVETIHLPIVAGDLVPHFKTLVSDTAMPMDEKMEIANDLMRGLYRGLATDYHNQFKLFFRALASECGAPLLFHCSAGKDRTGFASALLLSALGVNREVVISDYLLTNEALKGKYDFLNNIGPLVIFFKTVRREYLEEALLTIERNFGSVEAYLTDILDVDIETLRGIYLE